MEIARTEEHIVAVKKEFLVENKIISHADSSPQIVLPSAQSLDNESLPSQHNNENSAIGESESSVNISSDNIEGLVASEVREGYKSNGYKIDDRDRRDQKKKDFTGGKDGAQNNSHGSKKRPRENQRPEEKDRLCSYTSKSQTCPWGTGCQYSHDPLDFLSRKPADINNFCYQYSVFGACENGIMCRYGSHHINYETGISLSRPVSEGGVVDRVLINILKKEVQIQLRKKNYDFKNRNKNVNGPQGLETNTIDEQQSKKIKVEVSPSINATDEIQTTSSVKKEAALAVETIESGEEVPTKAEEQENGNDQIINHENATSKDQENTIKVTDAEKLQVEIVEQKESVTNEKLNLDGNINDKIVAAEQTKQSRKDSYNFTPYPAPMKLVDFSNKVYIAPLTTVGNLPWRRVMKDFGADITCGEMAMSHNLVQGQASEWALLRRHASEDCFGIQVAGGQPEHLSKIAKLLENETSSDFVDLNCGCPLDTICHRGCGAGLLNKPKKLVDIVSAMTKALPSRQVTVKIRTGWDDKNPMAHKLIPMLQKSAKGRIAAIMIHGRSRLQRYSKLANWEYVLEAARSQDPSLPRIPVIGNGDIFSWDDWHGHCDKIQNEVTGGSDQEDPDIMGLTSCAMLGRGALIKPWLPQEIKEKRSIDISAGERLEMLKKFVNYGLEHWGSDTQGVTTTRRFLLEWLSFLHRYVPVGLTERQQKMQQRPPHFFGRDDLETLLGSANSNDWVRISEMLLGPVPDNFLFVAKHKSNSYAAEVGESNG